MPAGDSFFITTPIFYVNDVPAHRARLHRGRRRRARALAPPARRRRLAADRHRRARPEDPAHGHEPRRHAASSGPTSSSTEAWKPLLETIDIANDDFIRTTDARHETGRAALPAEALRRRLHLPGRVRGLLLRRLRGVQAAERPRRRHRCRSRASWSARSTAARSSCCKESNYFFRMSDFEQPLLDLYESQPDFVQPESVRNEIVQFVKQGLARPLDLAASRSTGASRCRGTRSTSSTSGSTRCSTTSRPSATASTTTSSTRRWPAVQLVGKDIARFHAVIWPAMLMAAGLPVPEARLRPRLAARRRREDVEVEADRHRAAADHRHLRLRRVPLLLHARHHVRPGRQLQLGRHLGALPGRARQRLRQPRLARHRHDHPLLRRRRARRAAS